MKHPPALLPHVIGAIAVLLSHASGVAQQPPSRTVLEPNRTIERQLSGGQSHDYEVLLGEGEQATFSVEQRSLDVNVTCYGPDGRKVLALDSFRIGDAEQAELIAVSSGLYHVRLATSEPNARTGAYAITLREVGRATEQSQARAAAVRAFANGADFYRQGKRAAMVQALAHYDNALAWWRSANDGIQVATTLYTIALTQIEVGNQSKALESATLALAAAQAVNDRRTEGRALNALGEVHNYFGDKRKAAEYYERALPLLQSAHDRAGEGNALNNLAVAYAHTGEKSKALALFEEAGQVFREIQDRRMLGEVAGNMGVTYDNLGEYRKALENHQRDLALKREVGERGGQAICLNNIATAYAGLGAYQEALDAYRAALAINRSFDNRRSVAINLNNIAWVYYQLADLDRALASYLEALAIVRALKDRRTTAVTLNNIGDIYADRREYDKALQVLAESLLLRHAVADADGEANTLSHLGAVFAKLGRPDKARAHFERALSLLEMIGNPYMLARTSTNLGALERQAGNRDRSAELLHKAVEVSRAIRDRKGEAAALLELARMERDRGNLEAAHDKAAQAMTALESARLALTSPALRAAFFTSARDVLELDIGILITLHARNPDAGYAAAALSIAERGRARSLLELLHESAAEIRQGVDPALLQRERDLESLISAKAGHQTRMLSRKHSAQDAASAERELDSLTSELERVQARVRQTSPRYAALTRPEPLNLAEIQSRVVDSGTVLLEYSLGSDKSFLCVVTPDATHWFGLPARETVERVSRRVYDLLAERNRQVPDETPSARESRIRRADESYFVAATAASEMLLGPASRLIANKRLLVVGDGILQYVPFAALPAPGATVGRRSFHPLIADHEIVTAPSASVLAIIREETASRKPADKAIAIVADPVFSAEDERIGRQPAGLPAGLPAQMAASFRRGSSGRTGAQQFLRLRFSREEAEQIARLAPAAGTLKALDFDASRETVMRPDFGRYRILHFATHSLFDDRRPDLSGVVLSMFDRSGRSRDGFLRLYDIYNLRLAADLVVLSACRTALGREIKGEGLIGLTRGFLFAGAPTVIASLWEVDDRATAELMKRLYQRMLRDGQTPSAALRSAQISISKTQGLDAPYYWAAFTLQGEWR